jgi:hypothetical protein
LSIVGMEATIKRAFAKEECAYWLSRADLHLLDDFPIPRLLDVRNL